MAENLNRTRLFANLVSEDVNFILNTCEERTLVGGEDLFDEGDAGDSVWMVQAGRVDVLKKIRNDVSRTLGSFGPGEIVGEMSFIDGSKRSATARTVETSDFKVLTRQAFSKVLFDRPEVAATFFQNVAVILADRVRSCTELYQEAVVAALDASGAHVLNLKNFAEEMRTVTVHLSNGDFVKGRILQMDQQGGGYTMVLKAEDDRITLVPYHAVQRIELG